MTIKRIRLVVFFFLAIFLLIMMRLVYLQVLQRESLTKQVTRQRAIDQPLKVIRGNFYDKNMIPFTDTEEVHYAMINPTLLQDRKNVINTLTEVSDYTVEQLKELLNSAKPVTIPLNKYDGRELVTDENRQGLKVVNITKRYGEKALARHVIGYLNQIDQVGASGLEKSYDRYLDLQEVQSIGLVGDAVKRSIPGLGYKVTNCFNEGDKKGIRLTLDYHIQRIVENVIENQIHNGAVVVTEVSTGNIVAMASRPNYSQDNVGEYIQRNGSELMNRALTAYDAGSIFKIVVASAALEAGQVALDSPFQCTGAIDIFGKSFACSKWDGHGDLNFAQGFAQSCNPVFISVGQKLGFNPIMEMAKKYGFGTTVPMPEGPEQQPGNLPNDKNPPAAEVANISIGQGSILVTPLQVADMVGTVANNGIRKKLNLVEDIVTDSGMVERKVRTEQDTRVISTETAQKIQTMMHETTISGTGKNANLDEYGGSAGKTGSAETGWVVDGETFVHAWFAGYFPVNTPKYAVVVFVENGRKGGGAAAPIFREIGKQIMEMNR